MKKKISIRGPIISNEHQKVYDWFGYEAMSPGKFSKELAEVTDGEVEIEINSPGGSVYAASDMYTVLKDSGLRSVGKIVGIAASAAGFFATGCDRLLISPTAQLMLHNASTSAQGDYRTMNHTSEFLKNVNQSIMNAYHLKSKQPFDKLKELMDTETFLTAQQAKELNFVDEIMFISEDTPLNNLNTNQSGLIPDEIINKILNKISESAVPVIENNLSNAQISEPLATNTQEEENAPMNLEELKNKHPELYEEVYNKGKEDGKKAENSRIKEIEDLALPGIDNLVNEAKFVKNQTAAELAVEIVKNQKAQGTNYLNNMQSDTQDVNNIGTPQDDPINNIGTSENQVDNEVAKLIAENMKQVRGA